jgi:predicted HTH transcriptional regulator
MVAFSNSQGGAIVIGVNDKTGEVHGLTCTEIHSPGILPDGVTIEAIKQGISEPRNKLLFENAKSLLPYTGVGSGITRVLRTFDKISFDNNIVTGEFVTTLLRDEVVEEENVTVNNEKFTENVGEMSEKCRRKSDRKAIENYRIDNRQQVCFCKRVVHYS